MENSSNSFARLFKIRESMRQNAEREQLKLIADNQRAAFLVRLYEQGQVVEVQKMAKEDLCATFLGRLFEKRKNLKIKQLAAAG